VREFVAGVRAFRRRTSPIPARLSNPETLFDLSLVPLSPAHVLTPWACQKSQQNESTVDTRGRRRLRPLFPVASGRARPHRPRIRLHRIQTHPVRVFFASGNPQKHCRHPHPRRDLAAGDSNPSPPRWANPPIISHSSDPNLTSQINPLIKPVRDDLVHPDLIRSNGLNCGSARNGTSLSESATCRSPNQTEIKIEFRNQILFKSCKIHNFHSVSPKITNNIPLESLGNVQSSSTIIIHILWVQFETIFKLS
jgi:hypothetical protein